MGGRGREHIVVVVAIGGSAEPEEGHEVIGVLLAEVIPRPYVRARVAAV